MISGQQDLQKAYQDDRVAAEYVARRFETPLGALLHRRQVETVLEVIRANRIARAIEIAPGPARVTVDVAPALEHVTLVDSSAQMLAQAARRLGDRGQAAKVRLVQADAFNLPLSDACQLVYSFRLIRHFESEDRTRLYREIHRVLEPKGWLVFDAVNEVVSGPIRARSKPGEHEHFDALLNPTRIREELQASGFELVSLVGVQHRYPALVQCQILIAPRSASLARAVMNVVDRSGGQPLEWVVICRRG